MLKRKYGLIFCALIFLVWILVSGLVWLFLIFIFMILLYNVRLGILTFLKSKNGRLGKIFKGFCLTVFIILISIGLRLLVFDIYKIPSSSMEGTLFPEDIILVNKLKYGPKLPSSPFEIPFVNIAFYLNKKARESIDDHWWDYKRLSGTDQVKNGDVMVIDMFGGVHRMIIVKRCMGIAGDTLKIRNGNVFVNGYIFNPSGLIHNNYQFIVSDKSQLFKTSDSLGFDIRLREVNENKYEASMSISEKNELENMTLIDSVRISIDTLPVKYPEAKQLKWTLDNYGPYIIPKKGMTISLNQVYFDLYNKVINDHEDANIEILDGYCYLNGKRIEEYTFKHDYYFMMGDNRKGSQDSRYWGLVPENRIIGRVQCVLFSNYKDEFQWKRFFKNVN